MVCVETSKVMSDARVVKKDFPARKANIAELKDVDLKFLENTGRKRFQRYVGGAYLLLQTIT